MDSLCSYHSSNCSLFTYWTRRSTFNRKKAPNCWHESDGWVVLLATAFDFSSTTLIVQSAANAWASSVVVVLDLLWSDQLGQFELKEYHTWTPTQSLATRLFAIGTKFLSFLDSKAECMDAECDCLSWISVSTLPCWFSGLTNPGAVFLVAFVDFFHQFAPISSFLREA